MGSREKHDRREVRPLEHRRLTALEMGGRFYHHLPDHYNLLTSILQGFALANGGLAIWYWIQHYPEQGNVNPLLALYLLTSILAVLQIYLATTIGMVFASWSPTWLDTGPIFIVGLLEFLMFSVLQSGDTQLSTVVWFGLFALFTLFAVMAISHVRARIDPKAQYDAAGQTLAAWYLGRLDSDRRSAGIGAAIAGLTLIVLVGLQVLNADHIWRTVSSYAGGGGALLIMVAALHNQDRDRRNLGRMLGRPVPQSWTESLQSSLARRRVQGRSRVREN
jgi:hypothetical protein